MWYSIAENPPTPNKYYNTRIDNRGGIRNEALLYFDGKMWWTKDRKTYIYYTPTHYSHII